MRRAFLLEEEPINREAWIEHRLQELAEILAVAVGGFSVMDNQLHVLVRLDPDVANAWSDEQVVRRWGQLFPPRDKSRQPQPVSETRVAWRLLAYNSSPMEDRPRLTGPFRPVGMFSHPARNGAKSLGLNGHLGNVGVFIFSERTQDSLTCEQD